MDLFLHDLNEAYSTGQLTTDDNTRLCYIDYAFIERQMSMTAASMYWREALQDCKIDRSLTLPFDRYRLSDEHRTDRGTSLSFDFGQNLSHNFITYSSSNGITLEQLSLAIYYAFLFKLTNGDNDLCVGMNINGKYKEEFMSVMGMFVNAIPLRCQLDPHWYFPQLIEHVKEMFTSSLEYSYFPFQQIVAQHPNATKAAFLETSFEFQSYSSKSIKNEVMIGNARLCEKTFSIKIDQDEIMSKFDFILSIQYDSDTNQLSCIINASFDLFDRKTVEKIAQRFHSMLEQLFNIKNIQIKKPIYELSLILPDEKLIMESMNNTHVLFPSVTCIHHEFAKQAMEHSQKIAVELDDQSLTYSELLYYVQVLSLNLLNEQRVIVGDSVCQCVERSLSMAIGMMAIEMSGAVYCPLSPRDPKHRLHGLIEQTESQLVLVHHLTKNKFNDNIILLDIDSVLIDSDMESDVDINRLSSVLVTSEDIAYIIFTSGSTGIPKAVCDLVRIDHNDLLYYQGRKDYQVKLHGQRIELGEIEQCLLDTSISACAVIKWGDDHLIAYVQSTDIDVEQLWTHCQSHLPPHMVPSKFIVLKKLPLNANGKIDRKLLPSPSSHFSNILPSDDTCDSDIKRTHDGIETIIHKLWCNILHHTQIPINTNIFAIGGHSLIIMELYHRYQTTFNLQKKIFSISLLFQHPTIIDHARFIYQAMNTKSYLQDSWHSLHLAQAPASFAQERIFLDEQIRFSSKSSSKIYPVALFYRVSSANKHVSITRLYRAFQSVIMKHSILRTALDTDISGTIMQNCLKMDSISDNMNACGFSIINLHDDKDRPIDKAITETIDYCDLFELAEGRVIRCHIFRAYRQDDDLSLKSCNLLTKDDFVLFNIHHSAFDGASISIFLHDLSHAYETDCSLPLDDDALQYIDYSVYERQMNMALSSGFWQSQLQEYNFECQLSLPNDRQRSSSEQRSGCACVAEISFDDVISTTFIKYTSVHNVTPFQLGLATFYAFLFKITYGQIDLCVSCFNANRHKSELQKMIGMFVSTLPYRLQLDSHWSFDELVKY
ncbi:unnamed protein product, partial [Rotaria sordida]